jgi:glutamate dehydrogenase (NAD(P)+)
MSLEEQERLTRKFVTRIGFCFGLHRDIPAPDVNTNAQIMAWIMDQYSARYGYTPGIVTGKPVEMGGSPAREAATGRGVSIITQVAARDFGIELEGARIALQGFGNVGSFTGRLLHEMGAKIIAVSDASGGLLNGDGFDVPALFDHARQHRTIAGFGGESLDNEALVELECDILIPAALGGVITQENADRIKARMVVEAANSPVTTIGDAILDQRGIIVVPDILANAGGVTASYFEWAQNIQEFAWEEERINSDLRRIMNRAYDGVVEVMKTSDVNMRTAAFMIAIQRVAEVERMRGGL